MQLLSLCACPRRPHVISSAILGLAILGAARSPAAEESAGVPIRFSLDTPGVVTLVIEDEQGRRVRNLLNAVPFGAGEHVVAWDGCNEGTRLPGPNESLGHYRIAPSLAPAGRYSVRGLVHDPLRLSYDFTVYPDRANPPWPTSPNLDRAHEGGWLADHSPPADVEFLPGGEGRLFIGSGVAEGGDGAVWTDLHGKKLSGVRRMGGTFSGVTHIARDRGERAIGQIECYVATGWMRDDPANRFREVRLNALTKTGDIGRRVLNYAVSEHAELDPQTGKAKKAILNGLAVHDGLMVIAVGDTGELVFIDVLGGMGEKAYLAKNPVEVKLQTDAGRALGKTKLSGVRDLAFDKQGRLVAIVDQSVQRFQLSRTSPGEVPALSAAEVIVSDGLLDPRRLTLDDQDQIFVSDWGDRHQVRCFTATGKYVRAIGEVGRPKVGPYNRLHMNHPSGTTITPDGHLWVAEMDNAPRRISKWTLDGELVEAFYGPPPYGGGGALDPRDGSRFYHAGDKYGMEFKLDRAAGRGELTCVYAHEIWNPTVDRQAGFSRGPSRVVYAGERRFLTNSYFSAPTSGGSVMTLWTQNDGVARPVAFVGSADRWKLLDERHLWPALPDSLAALPEQTAAEQQTKATRTNEWRRRMLFTWSDLDLDQDVQPGELTFFELSPPPESQNRIGAVLVMPDLKVMIATDTAVYELQPQRYVSGDVPVFAAREARKLLESARIGSSANELVVAEDGTVVTVYGPLRGYRDGRLIWQYHSQWPSLHAGHSAPRVPEYPGQLLATTRLLGWPVKARDGEAGELFALNSDRAVIYLMTTDGLFVQTLGGLVSEGAEAWHVPEAQRGMPVQHLNFLSESFWPTVNQTENGEIWFVLGKEHCSLARLDGLETVRRIGPWPITFDETQFAAAQERLQLRPKNAGDAMSGELRVALKDVSPVVDGRIDDWSDASWVDLERDGNKFTRVAFQAAKNRLYGLVVSWDSKLLDNTPDRPELLFKTGGALDLMLSSDSNRTRRKGQLLPGDRRLIVTRDQRSNGKTTAMLYEPVTTGEKKSPVEFSSPVRSITFDRVQDVGSEIELAVRSQQLPLNAKGKTGPCTAYEFSVPFALFDLMPQADAVVLGDFGILRGQAGETVERIYWHNKTTGLIADVPGEAELHPGLWGSFRFASLRDPPAEREQQAGTPPEKPNTTPVEPTLIVKPSTTAPEPCKLIKNLRAGKKQTMVVYGTSVTEKAFWPVLVRRSLLGNYPEQATFVNAAKSAMSSRWGLANLDERVLAHHPDLVLIEFALNDAYEGHNTTVARARENLEEMIDRIATAVPECEVILMTMNPVSGVHLERRPHYKDYYQMYRDVAAERKLRIIDHERNWDRILKDDPDAIGIHSRYSADGAHPNTKASIEVIAPAVFEALGLPSPPPPKDKSKK